MLTGMEGPQGSITPRIDYHPRVNKSRRNMPGRTAASIQDVADIAGVSIATVSRVLNSPNLVTADTASRVRKAIDQLGYVPNAFAQALITRSSRVIAVALPDIHGEFYSELLRGADAEARRLGYHLLVVSNPPKGPQSDLGLGPVLGLVDGLAVMITEPNETLVKRLSAAGIPMVVLDAAPEGSTLDTIVIDNEAGATEATEHLLSTVPSNRCYFLGGPRDNFDTARRAEAFLRAALGDGRSRSNVNVSYGEYSFESGRERALRMHEAGELDGAGILAGNDEIASGVLHAAREAGLSVPERVSIIGFDDTRLASLVRPMLSTVRVPMADVGSTAIQLLVRRIKDPESAAMHVRLTPTLVLRQSTLR